jgi:hypothetical protein
VFFDTLEHRQQDPVRELFPKCLRGGQAPMLVFRRKPIDFNVDDRPTGAVLSFERRKDSGSVPRGTGWGKPQGGGIPGEPGRRLRRGNPVADVPTGWRIKPLKRGRRREIRRRCPASRTIDDPGHCRSASGRSDRRLRCASQDVRKAVTRGDESGDNPVLYGQLSAGGFANRTRGCNAERRGDSSQVKLCRANPVSAPG